MKLFLSYGHDGNAVLVQRIRADLETAGHTVWVDTAEIKGGDDWRRAITDGLVESHYVLGFLSKHSVRDPGVCLDELAIALHVKGGTIATVLLEGDAAPPLSVSHIQWLDMHDWAERQEQDDFENWYRDKLDAMLAILANPVTQRFAGEIRELEERLQPVAQQADIGALVDRFTGREWLAEKVDFWRRSSGDSRLLWITGGPGAGKSAFAAWLAHRGRLNVIGLNLCAYNKDDRCDAGRVVRTLAFQVATRLPDYRRLLVDRLRLCDGKGADVLAAGSAALFAALLVEPLRACIDGGRSGHRFLVIIDGLDETVRGGRSDLAEIVAAEAGKLPPWIGIVVTSRREDAIVRQLSAFNPVEISTAAPENLQDVRNYLDSWLADAVPDPATRFGISRQIVEASGGNFLYLSMLRSAVTNGALLLDTKEDFPPGLTGLYSLWFQRRFSNEAAYAPVRPVFAVLVASSNPVPPDWLSRILRLSKLQRTHALEVLGTLVERRPEGLTLFHKSLRDWLLDPDRAGSGFMVDADEGAAALWNALWNTFVDWAQAGHATPLDGFVVAELPVQLSQRDLHKVAQAVDVFGRWSTLSAAVYELASAQAGDYAWTRALGWWQAWIILASCAGPEGRPDKVLGLNEIGDVLLRLGQSYAALKSYRDSLAIAARLVASDPANAEWQRDLSFSYNRIGGVQVAQGDGASALKSYRNSLAIAARLAASDPANAGWQRDLSVSFISVGDVQVAQGDGVGALKSYRDSLAIAARLVASDPANAGWQRCLLVSHISIGDVQMAQGDGAGALKSYRGSLAIAARLAASDPANAGWQRDLSVSYDRVGDVQVAQGDGAGALKSYRESLAVRERLAASDQANAGWQRDLSDSYIRIGDIRVAQGDGAGALKSYCDSLAIRERLAASDPANAGWQRDLLVSFSSIGAVQVAQGDGAGALKSYRDSLSIAARLAASDPANAGWQRDLSVSYERIGDFQEAQGDGVGALKSYRDSLAIAARLAASDPANAGWQRDLSVSYDRIGDVQVAQGDGAGALKSYRDSLAIRERLAASDPANAGWQRDLLVSHISIGAVEVAQGDGAGALKSYRSSLAIAARLAASDPTNAGWQRDLSVSYERIGAVQEAQGDGAGALKSYRDSLAIAARLAASDPANAGWQRDLIGAHVKIASIASSEEPRFHLETALEIATRMEALNILAPADASMPNELRFRLAWLP